MTERKDAAAGTALRVSNMNAVDEARLFDALCELEGAVLAERLRAIDRDDAALGARLRRLLTIDAEYAEHTARMVAGEDMPEPTKRIGDGDDIGAFRLRRKIGRGGMGVVYLAERRHDFTQHVAIKVMPRFAIDARSRERFSQERRLLAQLRHPHICSIVDGGELDDGTPWLAMEYVPGESLCSWCVRHAVPLRQRIALFLQLCDAVQYAHNRLVIHRDLKDSNVLIDTHSEGPATVKLLDFGIAKSLQATSDANAIGDDDRTAAQDRFFSPMTAAPEQIQGARATVAVDVYALGALLHQLLSGALPFAHPRRTPTELQQAILDLVPPKMSDVLARENGDAKTSISARDLRGELDAIVAQCLRKAPEERYSDVGALARDLHAWLAGHPISISGDDRIYRLRKFLRRNRTSVVIATAAALSLLAAFGVTLWQSAQLRVQRDAAQAAQRQSEIDRDRARAAAGLMRDMFEEADPTTSSRGGLLARELIDSSRRQLPQLDGQPQMQAELALALSESYAAQGLIDDSEAILGTYASSLDALGAADTDLRWRVESLRMSNRIKVGDDSPTLDSGLSALRRQARGEKADIQFARLQNALHVRRSEFVAAATTLEQAWKRHGSTLAPSDALRLRVDLGHALLDANRPEDARRICDAIDRRKLNTHAPSLQTHALRLIVRELRERPDARVELVAATEQWRETAVRLYGPDSLSAAKAYEYMVNITDDLSKKTALVTRAYAIHREKLPPMSTARARSEYNTGFFYALVHGRHDLAEPYRARAVEIGRRLSSRAHADVLTFELAWAESLNALGRHRECLQQLSSPSVIPEDDADALRLGALHLELARAAIALGRLDAARTSLADTRNLWARPDANPSQERRADLKRLETAAIGASTVRRHE